MLPLLVGIIAPIAALVFGLLEYPLWVIPLQAACIVAACIPFPKFRLSQVKREEALGAAALIGTMFIGFFFKCGIAYAVGRGIRAILS